MWEFFLYEGWKEDGDKRFICDPLIPTPAEGCLDFPQELQPLLLPYWDQPRAAWGRGRVNIASCLLFPT